MIREGINDDRNNTKTPFFYSFCSVRNTGHNDRIRSNSTLLKIESGPLLLLRLVWYLLQLHPILHSDHKRLHCRRESRIDPPTGEEGNDTILVVGLLSPSDPVCVTFIPASVQSRS